MVGASLTNAYAQIIKAPQKTPLQIYMERMDYYYSIGDYFRAKNLAKACLNLLIDVNSERKVRQSLAKSQRMESLRNQAFEFFMNGGDDDRAIALYDQILKENPKDSKSIRDRELLLTAKQQIPISELARVRKLKESGKLDEAYRILMRYGGTKSSDPRVVQLAISVNREKYLPTTPIVLPCDNEEINKLLAEANQAKRNCNFERIRLKASQAFEKCRQNRTAERTRDIASAVLRLRRELVSLRTDPSRTDIAISHYQRIYKIAPECIRPEFFSFLFDKGMNALNLRNCTIAVSFFQRAKQISPKLAQQNDVDALMQRCILADECEKNTLPTIRKLLSEATKAFNNCQYDEALANFELAKQQNKKCRGVANLLSSWQPKADSIKQNQAIVVLFYRVKSEADSLLLLEKCAEAQKLYALADSLNVQCGKLAKSDLAWKIAKCENCVMQQCVRMNLDSARRSQNLGYFLDMIRFYCLAYECADSVNKVEITARLCALKAERPDLNMNCVYCPPPPPPNQCKDSITTKATTFEIHFGLNVVNKSAYKIDGSFVNPVSTPTFNVGIGYQWLGLSNKIIDFRTKLTYQVQRLDFTQQTLGKITKVRLSDIFWTNEMNFHKRRKCALQIRPYFSVGGIIGMTTSDLSDINYKGLFNQGYLGYRTALGLEKTNTFYAELGFSQKGGVYNIKGGTFNSPFSALWNRYDFEIKAGYYLSHQKKR
jgi:tetratricopeptide (TPR) repeat protein